uniref:SCAN box domain-containing protein n=1 Tax=Crocodylus porosus TaxID=8502 RepID=A0A7M4F4E0_CROPO
ISGDMSKGELLIPLCDYLASTSHLPSPQQGGSSGLQKGSRSDPILFRGLPGDLSTQIPNSEGPERVQPRLLAQTLRDLATRWLQPETHTTQEIMDLIILEQFLTGLRGSSQRWVQRHHAKTWEETLWLAEDYTSAEGEGEIPK